MEQPLSFAVNKDYVKECYGLLKAIYLFVKEKEKKYNIDFNYEKSDYENINYSVCYDNDSDSSKLFNVCTDINKEIINLINKIWNEKIKSKEKDPFILENLNELLHNIRLNYISNKLQAYNICKFDTLIKELGIDKVYTELLPDGKVERVEKLLKERSEKGKD